MSDPQTAAEQGITSVLDVANAAGVKVSLTPGQLTSIAELVLGAIDLATGVSLKRAAAAGVAAAAAVQTVEQANAVLEAAAAAQEKP